MKKKVLASLLTGAMAVSLLAGCGGGGTDDANAGGGQSAGGNAGSAAGTEAGADTGSDTGADAASGDIYEVVMAIPVLGAEPSGIADVEAAINEITEAEIGVRVSLYPISAFDMSSQVNLMITSGDKIDLIPVLFTGVSDYVNKNAIIPLDDLYAQYGADIEKAEGIAMAGGYFDGQLYTVPSEEKWARSYGYFARTDIVEELGFTFNEDEYYTVEDLEELFAAYKEKYGEGYYCIAGTASNSEFYNYMNPYDTLGGTLSTGVLPGAGLDGETTVTNLYATPEYQAHAERMYDWAQKGYFSPDASTNTDAGTVQVQSGFYLGGFSSTETDMNSNLSRDNGYPMTTINLVEPFAATQMYTMTTWSITSSCENPEKTFQLLNLLYADNDLDVMLTYGLEGTSYKVLDDGDTPGGRAVIDYADGVDAASTPYNMPLHVFGDKLSIPVFTPNEMSYYDMAEEFNNSIRDDRKSMTLGYVFNATEVAAQKTAVDAVIQQYTGIINCGAQDPATVMPEFLKALEDAGIDEIIAANQAQLDAWLAEQ